MLPLFIRDSWFPIRNQAALAQLGERQTEDLKAPCSIHGGGISFIDLILFHTNICLFKIYVNI